MGIIFKKFRKDTYCEKCDTIFYQQCDAFSELTDRPLKCPKCGAVPYLRRGYGVADYYKLRGTNLEISAKSLYATIFIQIPSFILMSIPFLLLLIWILEVVAFATTYAIKEVLFLIPRWFGLYDYDLSANVLAIFVLILILFFLFRAFGYIYNYKRLDNWEKELERLRELLKEKERSLEESKNALDGDN